MIKEEYLIEEENIKISDVIELDFLQNFQDTLSKAIGISSITVDEEGNSITKGSGFCDFCMQLNRGNPKGLERCKKSDVFGGLESARTGKAAVYTCENGLMDFAAPILLNGKQIGTILGGQTLPKPPNKEDFIQIAEEIGADPEEYIKALEKVRIVPEEQVRAAADLLYLIAGEFSRMGYQRLSLTKMSARLYDNIHQIMAIVEEITASAAEITNNQDLLNKEIQEINQVSQEINEVSNAIKRISDNTKLLGINASIEAARIGKVGLGFHVVAERIQKLSGESRGTVDKIKQFTCQINESVDKTSAMGEQAFRSIEQQEIAIRDIVTSIEDLMQMSEEMKNLSESFGGNKMK